MRLKKNEITDKSIIDKILSQSSICRLAMNDGDYPYIVPLNYGYSDNCLYFHCASVGKKIDLLKRNNKVSFEIEYFSSLVKNEISCEWSNKYRSVIGNGTIEILTDLDEKLDALQILMAQYGRIENDFDEKLVKRVTVLKLSIKSLTGKQSDDWDL